MAAQARARRRVLPAPCGCLGRTRVFIGLAAVYVSEFFATLGIPIAEKALGFGLLGTAGRLFYLSCAATLKVNPGRRAGPSTVPSLNTTTSISGQPVLHTVRPRMRSGPSAEVWAVSSLMGRFRVDGCSR